MWLKTYPGKYRNLWVFDTCKDSENAPLKQERMCEYLVEKQAVSGPRKKALPATSTEVFFVRPEASLGAFGV
jgi:hypothetical protein